MSEIFQVAAFVLVSAVLTALLKEYLPAYAALCAAACAALLLAWLTGVCAPVAGWFKTAAAAVDGEAFLAVLRAAGIALVAQTMQDVCKDAGLATLAGAVELAGRCLVLACALPLFETIMEALVTFLR